MKLRHLVLAAVAAMGLAGATFAADEAASQKTDQVAATAQETAKVNINTATAKELIKVKGLSAANAKAIVSYRKKHGDFKSTDELSMVKSFKHMKEEKMQQVKGQLTVE